MAIFLINRRHLYSWVAVISWLNHLILAVDLRSFSTRYLVKCALNRFRIHQPYFTPTRLYPWFPMLHICTIRITLSPPLKSEIQRQAEARWPNDYGDCMFDCHRVWLLWYDQVVAVLLSRSYVFSILHFWSFDHVSFRSRKKKSSFNLKSNYLILFWASLVDSIHYFFSNLVDVT